MVIVWVYGRSLRTILLYLVEIVANSAFVPEDGGLAAVPLATAIKVGATHVRLTQLRVSLVCRRCVPFVRQK